MISAWLEEELNKLKFGLIARGFEQVGYGKGRSFEMGFDLKFEFMDHHGKYKGIHVNLSRGQDLEVVGRIRNFIDLKAPETESEKVHRILNSYEDA